jgi:hypothetical protein
LVWRSVTRSLPFPTGIFTFSRIWKITNFEHVYGVLDVQNGRGAIDGTIYLRQPADPGNPTLKNSQLWKALLVQTRNCTCKIKRADSVLPMLTMTRYGPN